MDDLISRQAAIDAVAELASSMSVCISVDECHGMKRMQGMAVRVLDELPSAQPEIILCKNCIYYRQEIDMCDEPHSTAHNIVHEDDYCSRAERKEG